MAVLPLHNVFCKKHQNSSLLIFLQNKTHRLPACQRNLKFEVFIIFFFPRLKKVIDPWGHYFSHLSDAYDYMRHRSIKYIWPTFWPEQWWILLTFQWRIFLYAPTNCECFVVHTDICATKTWHLLPCGGSC